MKINSSSPVDSKQENAPVSSELSQSEKQDFSFKGKVKESKDKLLKERLQVLILASNQNERDFYKNLGLSKQYWYALSWGIWKTPLDLKLKIAKALGVDTSVIWQEQLI